ncbi:DUF4174 domain-containing protein [Algicella marina]|uniref:DUF4174 domain-containing protein n=1 Tax=Algicella marina TaxID=2683284 RepID=A0A6P1SWY7_9RHOB|nr:DUF4174 domain-containing protein [Algicella marina]QHQ34001.1 DUF4174 domain-containing protein [Algicella marina]
MVRVLALVTGLLGAGSALMAADLVRNTAEEGLDAFKWVARPVVIFADAEADPRVAQQLQYLEQETDALLERDVIIIVDTDPAANGPLRQKLRPRDFMFVLVGKDGQVKYRKPDPVPVRELMRLIDRMPMRQQEVEAQRSGG